VRRRLLPVFVLAFPLAALILTQASFVRHLRAFGDKRKTMKLPCGGLARWSGLFAGLVLLLSSGLHADSKRDTVPPKSKGVRVITLEGTPYARGLQHGTALKNEIHALLRLWKAVLQKDYHLEAAAFTRRFLKKTDFLSAMKRWTPDLIEEVKGIAAGAGVDFETMLLFQLPDEYWVNGRDIVADRCTGLGMSCQGKEPTIIAQNLDVESFRDGYQIVLHIKHADSDLEAFVLSFPGLIGANGMNNKGVGICCNTLSQLAYCRDGLPVNCVIRGLLEQRTLDEAIAFLHRIKHASGQNYLVGGRDRATSFECSAGKVCAFQPAGRRDVVWHTNHPLVNDDYNAAHRQSLARHKNPKPGSSVRLQCVEQRLAKMPSPWGIDVFKATLSSHDSAEFPICVSRGRGDVITFASTIMVLGERPELHIAPGPPDAAAYATLTFGKPTSSR
jgi:isopenicillin-N N-acyltransferase like protein